MSARLNRIAKYTTDSELELVRDVLSGGVKNLDKPVLRKRISTLRRHADKARARGIEQARKGMSGELSKRKAAIFREALMKCERRLLDIEVEEAREQHKAAARKALNRKRGKSAAKKRSSGRTAAKGMASKPRSSAVPRLTAGREKGHVLGVQRRGQAKRDKR